jgi:hypothetical protein
MTWPSAAPRIADRIAQLGAGHLQHVRRQAHEHLPGERVVTRMQVLDGSRQIEHVLASRQAGQEPANSLSAVLIRRNLPGHTENPMPSPVRSRVITERGQRPRA